MAINKAIIQIRRGLKDDLQIDKLLPGELAIATDAPCMWFCWSVGNVEQVPTSDNLSEVVADVLKKYLEENPVVGISEIYMRVYDGYIQYSSDNQNWENVISIEELKGEKGDPGEKGDAGVGIIEITQETGSLDGGENKISIHLSDGSVKTISIYNGATGEPGPAGSDASVTAENIKSALGYTPANAEKLDRIFEDVLTEVETVLSSGTNKTLTLGIDYKAGDTLKFECLTDNTGVAEISYEIYMEPSEPDEDDDLIEEAGIGFVTIAPMTGSEKSYTKMTVNSTMLSFSVNGYVTAYRIDYKNASGSETGDDGTDNSAVKYEPQELTDDQKAQARTNIGAASTAEVSQLSQEIVDIKAQGLQQTPLFANSVSDMTDTTKLYVLNETGRLWACVEKEVEGGTTPNFTNQLPISTDANGSVYNSKGYKENTYLSGASEGTKDGVNTTGFIPFGTGSSASALGEQVVRFANAELTAVSNTRINLYGETKNYLNTQILGTKFGDGLQVSGVNIPYTTDENGYITSVDLTQITYNRGVYAKLGEIKFIRICGAGIDSDTIITANEEITYTTTEGGVVYEWVDTGRSFVANDNEERIIDLENQTEEINEEIASIKKDMTSNKNVSTDILEEVSSLVDKALSRNSNKFIRFISYADSHQDNSNSLITKGNIELGQAIGEVLNNIGVDFVNSLGDNSWGAYANTTEEVREQLKAFNGFINPYIKGEQRLDCEGNHDDANYSMIDNDGNGTTSSTYKLSKSEVYSLIYAKNKGVVYDENHYIDGYCYKDFEHLKTRVICLNTEQGSGDGGVIEGYQLKWFSEIALDMTDKTDWNVITLAHHPLDYPMASLFRDAVNIIEAFINGSSLNTTTNDGVAINVDYSNKSCQYVGHFHGHAHAYSIVKLNKYATASADSTYTELNAYQICIPNACYVRNNQYVSNSNVRFSRHSTPTTYNKSDVDGRRTSFNLVTIDLENKVIYADNYGVGIDRQVSY